jgi:type I restriction enzyme S subunit
MTSCWRRRRLADLCEVTSSRRTYAKDHVDQGVPFYRSKEIIERYNGQQTFSTELFISEERYSEIKREFGVPVVGDVLLTSRGSLGTPYIVRDDQPFYFADGNLTWFRRLNGLDFKFLYYWFISPSGKAELQKCTIGSSQQAYTIVLLKEIELLLPPLVTQEKIAGILCAYDDLIENNTRRIRILEEMATAIYREWFVHFRFPGYETIRKVDSPLGQIPKGWEAGTFTDVADILSGGTPKTAQPLFWGGCIPFFTPKDCDDAIFALTTERTLTQEGLRACRSGLLPPNTVIITARGTVGNVVMTGVPMAMNQSCYAIRAKDGFPQEWLLFLTKQMTEILRQNAHGAVFDTIIIDTFRSLRVCIPSHDVVDKFGVLTGPILSHILSLLRRNDKLRQTRDLLLPKLISGDVDVSKLDLSPEKELVVG